MLSKQKQDRQPALADSDGLARLSRPARIGIDAVWAGGRPTGTGVYTRELIEAILRMDTHNTYFLYFREADKERNPLWHTNAPNVVKRVVGPNTLNVRNQVLAYHLYRDRINLFHSPGYFLPFAWFGRKVVTIYDMNHIRFARNWWRAGAQNSWLSLTVQVPFSGFMSQAIITLSKFSAEDIARYLRISYRKIHVVYPGVRSTLQVEPSQQQIASVLERFQLDEFVLFVGTMSPMKNLERLIRAFALIARNAGVPGLKLVLAGRDAGAYTDRILRPLVRDVGCEDSVVFTDYLSDLDIRALYATARCVAQVSEGEGFGLPVAEAMYCGAPVVTANATALREVAGDAALLVDPQDVQAIATTLRRLSVDDQLRNDLRDRGFRQAQQFTWDHAAKQTLAVYSSTLGAKVL